MYQLWYYLWYVSPLSFFSLKHSLPGHFTLPPLFPPPLCPSFLPLLHPTPSLSSSPPHSPTVLSTGFAVWMSMVMVSSLSMNWSCFTMRCCRDWESWALNVCQWRTPCAKCWTWSTPDRRVSEGRGRGGVVTGWFSEEEREGIREKWWGGGKGEALFALMMSKTL